MNLAVIDAPPGPPGWEENRAHLIRIVDPLGRAVAWFAPEYGARCAGFAVRSSGQRGANWTQLFHSTAPRKCPPTQAAGGCIIRCAPDTGAPPPMPQWRYIARDPTALVMETMIRTTAEDHQRCSAAGLHLRLTAHLDDAALMLDLDAENQGVHAVSPQLAFDIAFAHDLYGSACTCVGRDATMTNAGQNRPATPDNNVFTLKLHEPPLVVIAEPAGETHVTFTLAPDASSDCRIAPSAHDERTGTLRVSAAPAHGVALAVGARSRIGITIRTIPRDDRP